MERIENYVKGRTFEEFSKNTLVIDAVVRNFEIIGEATKHIPAEIKTEHPVIKWKEMAAIRDKLQAYEYFAVNIEILWKYSKEPIACIKTSYQRTLNK